MGGFMTSIALDGVSLNGKEIKMQITYTISTEDLSGQSSSTADAETGHKAQVIRVRMLIPENTPDDLKAIRQLAGKLDEDGTRHIYTIVNDTAEAMDIRQVKFYGDMAIRQDERLKAWRTTFLLKEHRSIAEKQEQQQDAKAKDEVQQTTDEAVEIEPTENTEKTFWQQLFDTGEDWLKNNVFNKSAE
jgi:hypothetical protein